VGSTTSDQVLARADIAMFRAKTAGGNRVVMADDDPPSDDAQPGSG
jgi:predicted signal transduction protein with EAL and GGDEF domain